MERQTEIITSQIGMFGAFILAQLSQSAFMEVTWLIVGLSYLGSIIYFRYYKK
jgi:multisubunit Na+/H+ antiporter MnhF subunit